MLLIKQQQKEVCGHIEKYDKTKARQLTGHRDRFSKTQQHTYTRTLQASTISNHLTNDSSSFSLLQPYRFFTLSTYPHTFNQLKKKTHVHLSEVTTINFYDYFSLAVYLAFFYGKHNQYSLQNYYVWNKTVWSE